MAILLHEEGIYEKCQIYATDMNAVTLQRAEDGMFPVESASAFSNIYKHSGGKGSFSDFYTPENLVALEAILGDLDQNLVKANSGREALRCLLRQDFAVIVLDVNMPEINGFETAALIRQRKSSEHTPIIFLSAISTAEMHSAKGYALGAVDYIAAPVIPDVLRTKVTVFVKLLKKKPRRSNGKRSGFARSKRKNTNALSARRRSGSSMRRDEIVSSSSRSTCFLSPGLMAISSN